MGTVIVDIVECVTNQFMSASTYCGDKFSYNFLSNVTIVKLCDSLKEYHKTKKK